VIYHMKRYYMVEVVTTIFEVKMLVQIPVVAQYCRVLIIFNTVVVWCSISCTVLQSIDNLQYCGGVVLKLINNAHFDILDAGCSFACNTPPRVIFGLYLAVSKGVHLPFSVDFTSISRQPCSLLQLSSNV